MEILNTRNQTSPVSGGADWVKNIASEGLVNTTSERLPANLTDSHMRLTYSYGCVYGSTLVTHGGALLNGSKSLSNVAV